MYSWKQGTRIHFAVTKIPSSATIMHHREQDPPAFVFILFSTVMYLSGITDLCFLPEFLNLICVCSFSSSFQTLKDLKLEWKSHWLKLECLHQVQKKSCIRVRHIHRDCCFTMSKVILPAPICSILTSIIHIHAWFMLVIRESCNVDIGQTVTKSGWIPYFLLSLIECQIFRKSQFLRVCLLPRTFQHSS